MKCDICGVSDKDTRIINSSKYGCLCRKHYLRKYKGKNIERSKYDMNEYVIYDSYAEIILYDNNNNEVGRAIIDLDDIEKCLCQFIDIDASKISRRHQQIDYLSCFRV